MSNLIQPAKCREQLFMHLVIYCVASSNVRRISLHGSEIAKTYKAG